MSEYRIKVGKNLYFVEWDSGIYPVFVIDNMIGALKEARVYKTIQDAEKDNQWIEGEIVEVGESEEND